MVTFLLRLVAKTALALTGWRAVIDEPLPARYVMIAAPHTSNWDLPYMLFVSRAVDVKLSFMVKHEIIAIPVLGWFLRYMGGIPIVRSEKRNMVQQMVDRFDAAQTLALAVQPEGTRRRVDHWKSGFYRIALGAGVPLVLGYLDFARRTGGFGRVYRLTGDPRMDMDVVRAFYADKRGKFPERFGPVGLEKEETFDLEGAPAPAAVAGAATVAGASALPVTSAGDGPPAGGGAAA
jgi:1-acyl-sn-glycerol-3-phosphate acyltransferase